MDVISPFTTIPYRRASEAGYVIYNPPTDACSQSIFEFDHDPPLVSICIPTLNNGDTLDRCLSSFANQSYPNIELVVIDGGSSDGSEEIAKDYADAVVVERGSLGPARAAGLEESQGEIVGLFDSDIYLPDGNWLSRAVRRFNYDDSVSTVWPENVAPPGGSALTELYFDHWHLIMESRIRSFRSVVGGGNSLFRRDHLDEIGGIGEDYHWGEDFDWAQRFKFGGYSVVYHRDPIYHDTMRSFREFASTQLTGAKSFGESGLEVTGMSLSDHAYEQIVLGLYGMLSGLSNKEWTWLLFPFYITIKCLAYSRLVARELVS